MKGIETWVIGALLCAGLGSAAGLALRTSPAQACDCVEPTHAVELSLVESEHPDVDHAAFWPEFASVSADTGWLSFRADGEPGKIARIYYTDWRDEPAPSTEEGAQ